MIHNSDYGCSFVRKSAFSKFATGAVMFVKCFGENLPVPCYSAELAGRTAAI